VDSDDHMLKRPLMVVFCLFVIMSSLTQSQASTDLDELLRLADARRQEYVETFRDLIAIETRHTEVIDQYGKTERQRTLVSDFLVYQSELDHGRVAEYRIAREVDGRVLRNATADGIAVFRGLAASRTLAQESRRLQEANLRHAFGRTMVWGMTLWPAGALAGEWHANFTFTILGNERMGERDVTVLGYEENDMRTIEPRGRLARFRTPRLRSRGRVCLAADGRLLLSEDDTMVVDEEITTPHVWSRTEIDYEPSAFGIMTPSRIVILSYDRVAARRAAPTLRLVQRTTLTYDQFRRFEVTTDSDVHLPSPAEP
jgi:hypothetical protein